MDRRTLFIRTLAIGAAMVLTAGTALAQDVTLRFAHYGSPGDSVTAAAERFAELAAEKSGGSLAIEMFPGGELGNSPTMLEGARLGTIDIVTVGNPYFTSSLPQLNITDLPFLFQSDDHAFAVFDGEIGDELLASMSGAGLQGLAFWELGFRNLTNSERAVSGPADIEGLKLRTTPNPAHVLAFETLGANPTPMPFAEVYSALQTGTIDGQENPVNHIYANNLHEVQSHLSLTEHAYTTSPLVMNANRWNSLTDAQKTALKEAAVEAAIHQRTINDEEDVTALAAMKKAGVNVVEEPDRGAFREAVAEVTRAAYVEQFGDDMLTRIDALAN